ncbi:hypothetical protein C5167_016998 [Papaver somniferum]|uniref:RNase H type-1 domain-containing protein n=1 Tax=Papaver somniferum TaxID=3469 RepID=A0A4Y7IM78_PAPSO|nr:hypothetical protein C5167_016998 [Papaver somniferum]
MLSNCTTTGIAILIRDHAGRFVEGMRFLQHARNITQVEAWGFLHAMQWARAYQYNKVIFENDNKQISDQLSKLTIFTLSEVLNSPASEEFKLQSQISKIINSFSGD